VERAHRLSSGRTRARDGREVPGRRRTVRLHRRRIEHVAERPDVGRGLERARDVGRFGPALCHRRRSRLSHRNVRRRPRRDADRARQEQHRRSDRVERRISGQQAAFVGAVRGLRHGGNGRFQLHRDAPARSQADVAARPCSLQRRTHAPAGRGRARGDRMDGTAGDEGRPADERRGADRSAAREASQPDRGSVRRRGSRAPARRAGRRLQGAARCGGRDGARQGSFTAAGREEGAVAGTRERRRRGADARRDLRPRSGAARREPA